ncbi:glycoside hydrolase, partial [Fistulina hepatica ATCC 64428]
IPSDLVAGQYLVRHEFIALHSAEVYSGAQFYPMCFQIQIDDSGDLEPETSDLAAFPGVYQGSDPGITIDIYETITNYIISGPEL